MQPRGHSRGRARGGDGGGGRGYSPDRGGRGSGSYDGGRGRAGGPSPRGGGFRGGGRGGPPPIFNPNTPLHMDERLGANELNTMIASFNRLQVDDPVRPLRPGFGTLGNPISLRANFFAVKVPRNCVVHDYQVSVSPEAGVKRVRSRILHLLEETSLFVPYVNHIAHDGSQRLVSSRQLPQPLSIEVPFLEEGETSPRRDARTYIVSIGFVRSLDTNELTKYMKGQPEFRNYDPAPLIGALNLVLQRRAAQTGIRIGQDRDNNKNDRNKYFFPLSSRPHRLGPGLIAIQGYYASVRPAYKELMVNVNVCMAAFIDLPDNVANALLTFNRGSRGAMPTLPSGLVRSIKVTTQYLGYKKRTKIYAIGTTSARNTFFPHETLGRISVENYFKNQYPHIRLQHATDVPVIDIRGPKSRTPVYVPAELCMIEPGQVYREKLSSLETREMIRVACNPPTFNAESIVGDGFTKLGLSPPSPPVTSFGISVSNDMVVIPARELPPPSLQYRARLVNANNGSWNITGDLVFTRGASVKSWWILVVRDGNINQLVPSKQDLVPLRNEFNEKLKNKGLQMPTSLPRLFDTEPLPPVSREDPTRRQAITIIRNTLADEIKKARASNAPKPDFILVLLANTDNFIYPAIKKICDSELGINTVHLQLEKAMNPAANKRDQYLSNVALKVNTKLGGINHQLDSRAMDWLRKKKTMMVGIDVTHRGPGSKDGTPSIAAVVANVDEDFIQFPASMRIQGTHEIREASSPYAIFVMVLELRDMMVERLLAFEKRSGSLPERIIVFRDGVSEGQYDIVISRELTQILEAFKRFNTSDRKKSYRPKISIIICGKRHHARFYPTNVAHAAQNGNTRPGTVVDKGVTGVFDFDFYLQAHAGIQGTVRPTHYVVIYDETKFGADEIQQGAHHTSYLYARATRAVSLVPPAYYADLACERGRCYLNDFLVGNESDRGSSAGGRSDKDAERQRVFEAAQQAWGHGVNPSLRDAMFYI